MSFFTELKRRNVFRVAAAYLVSAWVIIEVSSLVLDIFGAADTIKQVIVALLVLGLPFAVVFAWVFEVTPGGIRRETELEKTDSIRGHTGRRLDLLTIAMVVIAIGLLAADRFLGRPAPVVAEPVATGAETAAPANTTPGRDELWATRQLLEIDRLRDAGKNEEAYVLALEVAPLLEGKVDDQALWADFSYAIDIRTEPPGARFYRQANTAGPDDWELVGITPLESVRIPLGVPWRVKLELKGHRDVEMFIEALWNAADYAGGRIIRMDTDDSLPADMVRVPGFTRDLVEYGDFFMDRFEVTNRDYARFVDGGGYAAAEFWTEPFIRDGDEVAFAEALATFTDRTGRPGPATWSGGAYPTGQGDYPVGGISWYEAAAYARFAGKELPAKAHHDAALIYYLWNSYAVAPRSNFSNDGPWPVGENRAMSSLGVYDQIGNVREWCWNPVGVDRRCTTGGAWTDIHYNARALIAKSPWDRDATHGFRLVRTFDGEEKTARLRRPEELYVPRDFYTEQPAADAEFEIYKRMYAYDDRPLNAEIVATETFDYWTREQVAFDLPGGRRGGAFLFIPSNATPPFDTIVYWPGSDVLDNRSIDDLYEGVFGFLMKSGRAVAVPWFWGTFNREEPDDPINTDTLWPSREATQTTKHRDEVITWVKELSTTIDYLEERPEFNTETLGFYGISWGGGMAPIAMAIEQERLKSAVVPVGGLDSFQLYLPEVDAFNFVTRMRQPTLMINGEYDVVFPLGTGQKPMFDLMGTDPEHKRMHLVSADHWIPRDILIRETLDWFDRYQRQ